MPERRWNSSRCCSAGSHTRNCCGRGHTPGCCTDGAETAHGRADWIAAGFVRQGAQTVKDAHTACHAQVAAEWSWCAAACRWRQDWRLCRRGGSAGWAARAWRGARATERFLWWPNGWKRFPSLPKAWTKHGGWAPRQKYRCGFPNRKPERIRRWPNLRRVHTFRQKYGGKRKATKAWNPWKRKPSYWPTHGAPKREPLKDW